MLLKLVGGKILVVHLVVPFMESDTVVVDLRMKLDELIEMPELLVPIELVFVGLHDGTCSSSFHGSCLLSDSIVLPFNVFSDSLRRYIPGRRDKIGWCPER